MMQKRLITFIAVLFLLLTALFADNKTIAIFNANSEGISSEESSWLPASVRRKFESNFNDYTDYKLVDVQNEVAIKNIQKKAEGANYDQNTSIEIGKLVSAKYALFSTVTKANNKYILSANITDLTTGLRLSSVTTESVSDCSALFEGAGCSVNKITVKFCENLNITLSAIDRFMLLKGDELSNEEQLSMTEEEVSVYKTRIDELERKIKSASLSADLDAESKKAKLEAEKALMEQQSLLAKERLARLQKERAQLLKDQLDQDARSEAQKKRISSVASLAEEKAKKLRQSGIENLGVDGQIAIIEAKKQSLLDIRQEVNKQADIIRDRANRDYNKAAAEIDSVPLRNAEKDSKGNILPEVKAAREAEKKEIYAKYNKQAEDDISSLKNETEKQESDLLKAISSDKEKLRVKRTASSITDSSILFIGNYDGQKYIWDATASLSIGGSVIFNQSANLSYEKVSGKTAVKPSGNKNDYNDYLDTVDLYDSMFRRKVPVIALEINYMVEAMDENYPSQYKLTIIDFQYVDVINGGVIQKITPAKSIYTFTVNPVVDLRVINSSSYSSSNIKNQAPKEPKYTDGKNNSSNTPVNRAPKKEEKLGKDNWDPKYDQTLGNGGRFNLGINAGYTYGYKDQREISDWYAVNNGGYASSFGDMDVYGELYLTVPFSGRLFMETDVLFASVPEYFEDEFAGLVYHCEATTLTGGFLGLGLNQRLKLGDVYPNLYTSASLGLFKGANSYYLSTGQFCSGEDDTSLFGLKLAAGIDFNYGDNYSYSLFGSYNYIEGLGGVWYFGFGGAFSL